MARLITVNNAVVQTNPFASSSIGYLSSRDKRRSLRCISEERRRFDFMVLGDGWCCTLSTNKSTVTREDFVLRIRLRWTRTDCLGRVAPFQYLPSSGSN